MKKTSIFSILRVVAGIVALYTAAGFGHAHIFIDYKVHACINEKGLEGFYISWTFDRMFTSFIQKEFDKDKDNVLSEDEQRAVFTNSFLKLEENNFFAVITVNGKDVPTPRPQKFNARIIKEKEAVSYTFFIPVTVPAGVEEKGVQIYFFDPVIYVAFTIMNNDVTMKNNSTKVQAKVSVQQVKHINRPTISFKEG